MPILYRVDPPLEEQHPRLEEEQHRSKNPKPFNEALPFLREISAQNMERYIEAVHQFTLSSREHAALAPWIRGRIPLLYTCMCFSSVGTLTKSINY